MYDSDQSQQDDEVTEEKRQNEVSLFPPKKITMGCNRPVLRYQHVCLHDG